MLLFKRVCLYRRVGWALTSSTQVLFSSEFRDWKCTSQLCWCASWPRHPNFPAFNAFSCSADKCRNFHRLWTAGVFLLVTLITSCIWGAPFMLHFLLLSLWLFWCSNFPSLLVIPEKQGYSRITDHLEDLRHLLISLSILPTGKHLFLEFLVLLKLSIYLPLTMFSFLTLHSSKSMSESSLRRNNGRKGTCWSTVPLQSRKERSEALGHRSWCTALLHASIDPVSKRGKPA